MVQSDRLPAPSAKKPAPLYTDATRQQWHSFKNGMPCVSAGRGTRLGVPQRRHHSVHCRVHLHAMAKRAAPWPVTRTRPTSALHIASALSRATAGRKNNQPKTALAISRTTARNLDHGSLVPDAPVATTNPHRPAEEHQQTQHRPWPRLMRPHRSVAVSPNAHPR